MNNQLSENELYTSNGKKLYIEEIRYLNKENLEYLINQLIVPKKCLNCNNLSNLFKMCPNKCKDCDDKNMMICINCNVCFICTKTISENSDSNLKSEKYNIAPKAQSS